MVPSDLIPLYMLIGLASEFALKALFETWSPTNRLGLADPIATDRRRVLGHYILYRLCTWGASAVGFVFLFELPFVAAVAAGAVLSFVGSVELLTAWASAFVYARTSRPARYFHVLYAIGFLGTLLALASPFTWGPSRHAVALDEFLSGFVGGGLSAAANWVLIFFAAWIPANDLIRWLMNKHADRSLAEDVVASGWGTARSNAGSRELQAEAAATEEALTKNTIGEGTFRAGRVIGVLERWLLLAFLIRGELVAIGFIFTAKSIVRFREFRKTEFTEYYLVGTLYSILITLGLSLFLP